MTHQVAQYTRNKGLAYDTLKKLILQLAHNAGEEGFKRSEAFEGLEQALPSFKDHKAKQYYITRILVKMQEEGLLKTENKKWFITEMGEMDIRT